MCTHDELLRLALSNGAQKAAIIRAEDILVSSVFRDICASNSCGKYGRCWMCPPDIGEIDALMAQLKSYSHGLLYQTIYEIEDSFDIEGMGEASRKHARVSQRVNDAVKPLLPAACTYPAAAATCVSAAPSWTISPVACRAKLCRQWKAMALMFTTLPSTPSSSTSMDRTR